MPRTPTKSCLNCGKPVWTGITSRDLVCCHDCRRHLTFDQKVAMGVIHGRRSRIYFLTCAGCSALFTGKDRQRKYCTSCSYTAQRNCVQCGQQFTATGTAAKYCSADCRAVTARTKAQVKHAEAYAIYLQLRHEGRLRQAMTMWRCIVEYLAERDGVRCGICGDKVRMDVQSGPRHGGNGSGPSIDHIVPRSVDPALATDLANLRLTHWRCNVSRGNRWTGTEQLALFG